MEYILNINKVSEDKEYNYYIGWISSAKLGALISSIKDGNQYDRDQYTEDHIKTIKNLNKALAAYQYELHCIVLRNASSVEEPDMIPIGLEAERIALRTYAPKGIFSNFRIKKGSDTAKTFPNNDEVCMTFDLDNIPLFDYDKINFSRKFKQPAIPTDYLWYDYTHDYYEDDATDDSEIVDRQVSNLKRILYDIYLSNTAFYYAISPETWFVDYCYQTICDYPEVYDDVYSDFNAIDDEVKDRIDEMIKEAEDKHIEYRLRIDKVDEDDRYVYYIGWILPTTNCDYTLLKDKIRNLNLSLANNRYMIGHARTMDRYPEDEGVGLGIWKIDDSNVVNDNSIFANLVLDKKCTDNPKICDFMEFTFDLSKHQISTLNNDSFSFYKIQDSADESASHDYKYTIKDKDFQFKVISDTLSAIRKANEIFYKRINPQGWFAKYCYNLIANGDMDYSKIVLHNATSISVQSNLDLLIREFLHITPGDLIQEEVEKYKAKKRQECKGLDLYTLRFKKVGEDYNYKYYIAFVDMESSPNIPKDQDKIDYLNEKLTTGLYKLDFIIENDPSIDYCNDGRFIKKPPYVSGVYLERIAFGIAHTRNSVFYNVRLDKTETTDLFDKPNNFKIRFDMNFIDNPDRGGFTFYTENSISGWISASSMNTLSKYNITYHSEEASVHAAIDTLKMIRVCNRPFYLSITTWKDWYEKFKSSLYKVRHNCDNSESDNDKEEMEHVEHIDNSSMYDSQLVHAAVFGNQSDKTSLKKQEMKRKQLKEKKVKEMVKNALQLSSKQITKELDFNLKCMTIERWLKEDDDMHRSSIDVVQAIMISKFMIDDIKFSGNKVIVFWADGTKTIVGKQKDETKFDIEKAIFAAFTKKALSYNVDAKGRSIDNLLRKCKQKYVQDKAAEKAKADRKKTKTEKTVTVVKKKKTTKKKEE